MEQHDREQHLAFMAMPADAPVWISEPVQWLSEWRYYVANNAVVGRARYDSNEDEAPEPDEYTVKKCIRDMATSHPYVLDFGVLSTGETALVEANDAWAIGLYAEALSPRDYLYFLRSRWRILFKGFHVQENQ